MTTACGILLLLVTTIVLIPTILIALQVGAAFVRPRRTAVVDARPKVAVVVPAHNESRSIQRTIESIRAQLPPGGRLLVVADNCTDATASVAAAAGAEVSVRREFSRIGKGYALDHGVSALKADPPDVVVFVDADCQVSADALDTIAKLCFVTRRPVQARYSMQSPPSAGPFDRVAQFAWTVKTLTRPAGAAALGWPCQLMGTGMALPWEAFGAVDLATGHLAEDQKLGADLVLAGKAPIFCQQAHVSSHFPAGKEGRRTQRTRWEHGHLAIIREYFPRLLVYAIRNRSLSLLAFAIDLCVPPLSFLVLALTLIEALDLVWFATAGGPAPLLIASISILLLTASLAGAWWRFGRDTISLRDLLVAPVYCLVRLPSFLRFFVNRQIDWIRTERL